jgi:hypothetical protein
MAATVTAKADVITFVGGTYENVQKPGFPPGYLSQRYTENGMSVTNNGRTIYPGPGGTDIAVTEISAGLLKIVDNHANVYDFTYIGGQFNVVSVDGLRGSNGGYFFFVGTHADGTTVSSSFTFGNPSDFVNRPPDLQRISQGSSIVLGTGFQNLVNLRWDFLSPQPGVIASGWGDYTMDGLTYHPATPTPEPTTLLLLGTGLSGIAVKIRKRRKNAKKSED